MFRAVRYCQGDLLTRAKENEPLVLPAGRMLPPQIGGEELR
jgi:hypothetical protein